jgi:multidrug efflux pump subunit AcrB
MLPVEVNGKAGDHFIVSKGLKAGDQYIVSGFDRLQPGTPVVAQKKKCSTEKIVRRNHVKENYKRPVLATVISVLLVILGIVGMVSLPITKFPDIAPPTVMVTAVYPGANAETIARSVAPPLENAINGVENMDYITSTASNDGTLNITVIFKLGTDPDQAAINVQNRVAQVTNQMPAEVIQAGITTLKRQNSMIAMVSLTSKDGSMSDLFLENYAKINIVPELKRVKGVGDAMVYGNKDYSMRSGLIRIS